MQSRVHPTYKTKYRVANWSSYDLALVRRGDFTVWVSPEAIASWEPAGVGTRGGQRTYSDLAIETALTLRLLFHMPLRQTEGFLRSLFGLMGLTLPAPDHTTLSRRGQHLDLMPNRFPAREGTHLVIDSTGLSIVGEGEWAAAKYGRRGTRGWKKLHVGVDQAGVIVAHALTAATVDDATTAIPLIGAAHGALASVTADTAYDTIAFYDAAHGTGRDRRRAAGQNGQGVATEAAGERSRSHDPEGDNDRPATVEEGIGLPSTGARGERLLPIQVDHRGSPSSPDSRRARSRGAARVQCPERDN